MAAIAVAMSLMTLYYVAAVDAPWSWRVCLFAYLLFMVSTMRWLWRANRQAQRNPKSVTEQPMHDCTEADYALSRPAPIPTEKSHT